MSLVPEKWRSSLHQLALLVHLALPIWWLVHARGSAIGHRTGDLVGHVWVIWSGVESWPADPTYSHWIGWPYGTDLLTFFGGWGHTFVGILVALALDIPASMAYSVALCTWLAICGLGGHFLARAMGASTLGGLVGGLLLQLDGLVLYHAIEGRPEHAGIGMAALAMAGAVALWKGKGGTRMAIATGTAGALCLVVGWEIGLWLAVTMAVLSPFFWWSGKQESSIRSWSIAAATTGVVGTPWVAWFLSRAMDARQVGGGSDQMSWAIDQSLPLLGWVKGMPHHPGLLALLCMLGLPWLIPKEDRRIWIGVGLGLVLSWVLATGPSPGLFKPGDLDPGQSLWGPYRWLQEVPVLGWFHSPGRMVIGWSLAAATAGALLVTRIAERNRLVALLIGAVLVGQAGLATKQHHRWPGPGLALPSWQGPMGIADIPGDEALLDLPPHRGDVWSEDAKLTQMMHKRPTPGSGFMPHLAQDRTFELTEESPFLTWLAEGAFGPAPAFPDEERAALVEKGLRFVALNPRHYSPRVRQNLEATLTERLGTMAAHNGLRWWCWDLVEPR